MSARRPGARACRLATLLVPVALCSLIATSARGQEAGASATPATNAMSATAPVQQDLALLREVFAILATTRSFDEVTRLIEQRFGRFLPPEQVDGSVSYGLPIGVLSTLHVLAERATSAESVFEPRRVVAIQAVFRAGKVRLADLESTFGPWYRDPPDGHPVSLASAYFNARLVHPAAIFFLVATTGAGYGETLSRSEFSQTLVATWSDDRQEPAGRPW